MSLTYTTFVNSLANRLVVPVSDANFQTEVPNLIDYAELRMYRDLDLIDTLVRDNSTAVTAGQRVFVLPSSIGTFVVVEEINIITPAGISPVTLGARNSVVPTSKEVLDWLWPSSLGSTVPQYFARVEQNSVIFGPWPDQAYTAEVVGTIRPQSLSSTNVTTLLSVNFPDMFLAAAMIEGAAYLKNFGAAVDDPKMAVTWEATYNTLLQSAGVEEMRKKFFTQGTSYKLPAPNQTPPQT